MNLYNSINELITLEGLSYTDFQELVQKQFPNNLSDFSDLEIMKEALEQQGDEPIVQD